jgi:hypothetical protein
MRIICGKKITAMRIMGTNQKTNLANSSNMGPLSQVSAFTFVVNIFVNSNHPVPRERMRFSVLQLCRGA